MVSSRRCDSYSALCPPICHPTHLQQVHKLHRTVLTCAIGGAASPSFTPRFVTPSRSPVGSVGVRSGTGCSATIPNHPSHHRNVRGLQASLTSPTIRHS